MNCPTIDQYQTPPLALRRGTWNRSEFWSHHSTETALVKVANKLLLASDQGCIYLLVVLDLSFWYHRLQYSFRLESFVGINGTVLSWLRSYLSDCYQFVNANCDFSTRLSSRPSALSQYILTLGTIIPKQAFHPLFHCLIKL